jgi:YD repeat-containing protein
MDELITLAQAADILGLSEQRVRQLREQGRLTARTNPQRRQLRFVRDEVYALRDARDTWETEHREPSPPKV